MNRGFSCDTMSDARVGVEGMFNPKLGKGSVELLSEGVGYCIVESSVDDNRGRFLGSQHG